MIRWSKSCGFDFGKTGYEPGEVPDFCQCVSRPSDSCIRVAVVGAEVCLEGRPESERVSPIFFKNWRWIHHVALALAHAFSLLVQAHSRDPNVGEWFLSC